MTDEARIAGFVERIAYDERRTPITTDTPLLDSGLIDSTGIIELVTFLESEFGIKVADEEIVPENFETISRIMAFIATKRR